MTETHTGAPPPDSEPGLAAPADGQPAGAYFTVIDEGRWFVPTDHARGPWDPESCHGGPPAGLTARAMERALDRHGVDQQLVRLSVELIRPVPMAGFSIDTEVVRAGRSVSTVRARIVDAAGKERATATGVALRADLDHPLPTMALGGPDLDEAEPGPFPIGRVRHDQPGFRRSTELRYPLGESSEPGPTTVWMRTVPIVEGEVPSPFQRICPLADCGNAFSRNAEPWEVGFVNPDLTIVLHRPPVGEWLGSSSVSHWQPSGVGLADALLFDQHGVVGRALQPVLLSLHGQ